MTRLAVAERRRDRLPERGDLGRSQARDVGAYGTATGPRHDRVAEAESGGLTQATLQPAHRAQLAEQSDLADDHGVRWDGAVAEGRGQRQGDGEVQTWLRDGQPAGEIGVHVVAAEGDPGPTPEHGDEQPEAVRIQPARLASGCAVAGGGDERLDLDEQRPGALERRRHDAARGGL